MCWINIVSQTDWISLKVCGVREKVKRWFFEASTVSSSIEIFIGEGGGEGVEVKMIFIFEVCYFDHEIWVKVRKMWM